MSNTVATKKTRVVGYIRVSSDKQAEEGVSLAAQRSRIEAYATAMDLDFVTIVEDAGYSGKNMDRPGLQSALAMLDRGEADGVLVTKLDRLTRSVKDFGYLLDNYFASRFTLMSIGDSVDSRSAGGRLVLHVLMSVFAWERESAIERTREGMAQLRREGVRLGAMPLGYRRTDSVDPSGRLVIEPVPEEQGVITRIAALRSEGRSLRAIATVLNAEGLRPKKGSTWHPTTVARVLTRAA